MKEIQYDRKKAVEYAKKWAYKRNPSYYNYDAIGGDCTNFVSQCIFAGSQVMNYQSPNGWYYRNANQKSPSWTGVEFLYQFLTQNKFLGPYGRMVLQKGVEVGDIAQISFDGNIFAHTVIIINTGKEREVSQIYIASHTLDSFGKKLEEYITHQIRFIHIEGVRK